MCFDRTHNFRQSTSIREVFASKKKNSWIKNMISEGGTCAGDVFLNKVSAIEGKFFSVLVFWMRFSAYEGNHVSLIDWLTVNQSRPIGGNFLKNIFHGFSPRVCVLTFSCGGFFFFFVRVMLKWETIYIMECNGWFFVYLIPGWGFSKVVLSDQYRKWQINSFDKVNN